MNLPRTRAAIAALIPHQGAMCLWEQVLECDADTIRCATTTHGDPGHPLRREGRLHAVHLVEYAAQLMAIHGALRGGAAAAPGVLAAVRNVTLAPGGFANGELHGEARRLHSDRNGTLYDCRVVTGAHELLRARITVVHRVPDTSQSLTKGG